MRHAAVSLAIGSVGVVWASAERGPPVAWAQERDTVVARVDLTIGEATGAVRHEFGAVSGIAVDARGRIYVVDWRANHVVVFAPDGGLITTVGRRGQGPGEFSNPYGATFATDGSLYVRAVNGVSRFVADSAAGAAIRFDRRFVVTRYPAWTDPRAARIDSVGRIYHPHPQTSTTAATKHTYIRASRDGTIIDTIRVPEYANTLRFPPSYSTGPRSSRIAPTLAFVPFSALPVWDVTARGTLVSGDGTRYLLTETDPSGAIVRRFERTLPATRIAPAERAESTRALRTRLDTLPVPLDAVVGLPADVRELRLPSVYPAYTAVYVAENGRVWVRRWPPPRRNSETFLDVFEPDGRFITSVVLAAALAPRHHPVIMNDAMYGVIVDAATDTESVVRLGYRIP